MRKIILAIFILSSIFISPDFSFAKNKSTKQVKSSSKQNKVTKSNKKRSSKVSKKGKIKRPVKTAPPARQVTKYRGFVSANEIDTDDIANLGQIKGNVLRWWCPPVSQTAVETSGQFNTRVNNCISRFDSFNTNTPCAPRN